MVALLRQLLATILSLLLAIPFFSEAVGNRTQKTSTLPGLPGGWPKVRREADPHSINGAVSYVYDPVGNRTSKTSTLPGYPGGTQSYNANDQLSTDTYDANGNTTASNSLAYAYDFENHLIQQGGISVVYDGDGNRASKTVGGLTTTYLVDTQNPTGYVQVLQESFNYSGNPGANYESLHTYVYGLERISERRNYVANNQGTTANAYYVYDGHGSVRALADTTGTVTDTYDYDAFGNLLSSTGATPNDFLFAGEQYDSDLALYCNRARYVNTVAGRFWTADSLEGSQWNPLSLNKYLYAEASPVDAIDPSGHDTLVDTLGSLTVAQVIAVSAVVSLAYVCVVQIKLTTGNGCDQRDSERTFYHGTTLLDAEEIVQNQAFNIIRKIARQKNPSILDFGSGLYMTDSELTAGLFAELQGSQDRELGPAVVRVDIKESNWKLLVWQGAIDSSPISNLENLTQVWVPFYLVPELDRLKDKYSLALPVAE